MEPWRDMGSARADLRGVADRSSTYYAANLAVYGAGRSWDQLNKHGGSTLGAVANRRTWWRRMGVAAVVGLLVLAGCSSSSKSPLPAPITPTTFKNF
jgi:hypothetical protein